LKKVNKLKGLIIDMEENKYNKNKSKNLNNSKKKPEINRYGRKSVQQ
jgi:hypothetical protein